MKEKQKVDIIIASILILIGIITLLLPTFNITNLKYINYVLFSLYAILGLIRYLLTKDSKDYLGLHYFLISLVVLIVSFFVNIKIPKHLAFLFFFWIALMSIAKLKKSDYYHDRRDRMWKVNLLNLSLFLVIGIIACINLAHTSNIQILVIGFFLLIHGILELYDPIIKALLTRK